MKERLKKIFQSKTVKLVLLLLAALLLILAVWRVFFTGETAKAETERESRLSAILSKIEGVEGVDVMIGEEDGVPVSVVVVFRGKDGLVTRKRLAEAAAGALHLGQDAVLVYPAQS